MPRKTSQIVDELRAHAEYLDYSDLPRREEIAKTLQDAADLLADVSTRPENVHPGFDSDNLKEFTRDIVGTGNYLFTRYLRKEDKIRRFKTIRWLAHLAIEKLEKGK